MIGSSAILSGQRRVALPAAPKDRQQPGRIRWRAPPVDREDLKGIPYELFILGLAVLSIVNLVLVSLLAWGSRRGGSLCTSTSP
jgi:hypothetical protein